MAIHYVTSAGSGDGTGSSYANSMSLATHNAHAFIPDDIVYMCDTFTASYIDVPAAGTSGHPIVYRGDYTDHTCVIDQETGTVHGFRCAYSYISFVNFSDIHGMDANYHGISAEAEIVAGITMTVADRASR
jgi:hypothetical protein